MDLFLHHPEHMSGSDHVTLLTPGEFILLELAEIREFAKNSLLSENEMAVQWILNYGPKFRETWAPFVVPKDLIPKMKDEIARHRWIESEKHKRDLGRGAELDWIRNHSRGFIAYYQVSGKFS